MIAFRHKNPDAFNRMWRKWPKYKKQFDFRFYEYQVMDQVFDKDTPEFREALHQYEMMMVLTGK